MKRLFITLAILGICFATHAQTYSGRVTDSKGEPHSNLYRWFCGRQVHAARLQTVALTTPKLISSTLFDRAN